jgi:formate hydrogenlyase subunit 6/NADH:ubiquinone oxidoreductase subunit I
MNNDIYEKLREKIDGHSVGFNATKSGVEIKILKKLFTEEEAKLYLHLTTNLEPEGIIAGRAGLDISKASSILSSMKKKGLVFPKTDAEMHYYALAPFMHGFYEHQAHRIDKELAQLFEDYFRGGFFPKTRSLRTIPVKQEIDTARPIAPYDDVKKIIEGKDKIGLFKCPCYANKEPLDHGCTQPVEVCMGFDFYAEYPIEELGIGRWISREEALDVLDRAEKAGLVHQTGGNSNNTECICNCCVNCCGILRAIKLLPEPSKYAGSNYLAQIDSNVCSQCGTCIDRCPMTAISDNEGVTTINSVRCIGCGLCTTTCPTGAVTIKLKPQDKLKAPPENFKFMISSLEFKKDVELFKKK